MRIEDALSQVRAIQLQVARTERCCYRWATVAASGLMALAAAVLQSYRLADPVHDLARYLVLWIGVAAVSVATIGTEMLLRWLRTDSLHARRQSIAAVRQFVPCLAAGAVVTWTIYRDCPEHAALLPGLWSVFFSLGVFASARYVPPASAAIAVYYLVAGLVCIRWGQAEQALRPWTMVITFALGQWLTALVLYREQAYKSET
jgi:hypothetical protein